MRFCVRPWPLMATIYKKNLFAAEAIFFYLSLILSLFVTMSEKWRHFFPHSSWLLFCVGFLYQPSLPLPNSPSLPLPNSPTLLISSYFVFFSFLSLSSGCPISYSDTCIFSIFFISNDNDKKTPWQWMLWSPHVIHHEVEKAYHGTTPFLGVS